ncbi:SPOR domain-containing protein [Geobacillus thermodenitrificans]
MSKRSACKLYRAQVGAFANHEKAERLVEELKKKGYPAIIV